MLFLTAMYQLMNKTEDVQSNPTLVWIDVHTSPSKSAWQVIRKIQNEIWLGLLWERETFQTSASGGSSLHLYSIIQSQGEITRRCILGQASFSSYRTPSSEVTNIGVVLAEHLTCLNRGRASVESAGAKQRHYFEISIRTWP